MKNAPIEPNPPKDSEGDVINGNYVGNTNNTANNKHFKTFRS